MSFRSRRTFSVLVIPEEIVEIPLCAEINTKFLKYWNKILLESWVGTRNGDGEQIKQCCFHNILLFHLSSWQPFSSINCAVLVLHVFFPSLLVSFCVHVFFSHMGICLVSVSWGFKQKAWFGNFHVISSICLWKPSGWKRKD